MRRGDLGVQEPVKTIKAPVSPEMGYKARLTAALLMLTSVPLVQACMGRSNNEVSPAHEPRVSLVAEPQPTKQPPAPGIEVTAVLPNATPQERKPSIQIGVDPSTRKELPSDFEVQFVLREISRVKGTYVGAEIVNRQTGVLELQTNYPIKQWVEGTFEGSPRSNPTRAYRNGIGSAMFEVDGQEVRVDYRLDSANSQFSLNLVVQEPPRNEGDLRRILNLPGSMQFVGADGLSTKFSGTALRVLVGSLFNPGGSEDHVEVLAQPDVHLNTISYSHRQ